MMRRVVWKVMFAWQADKEEAWINSMSCDGWALVSVGIFRYVFEACQPGEYTYRIELLANHAADAKSIEYLHFLRDLNIQTVGSLFRWVYLRKRTEQGPFELYSGVDSRLAYFKRMRAFFLSLFVCEFSIGISNLVLAIASVNRIQMINFVCAIGLLTIAVFLGIALKKQTDTINVLQKEQAIRE